MSYTNNKIIPNNQNINISSYNTFNEENSTFTTNASESTKNSKTKQSREKKSNVIETMRNGKNIHISTNNNNLNQGTNINTNIFDYNSQNSTFSATTPNNLFTNTNNKTFIQNNIAPIYDNNNFSNHQQLNKKYVSNYINNIDQGMIIPKPNQGKNSVQTGTIQTQTNLNPYLVQGNNIPLSVNMPLSKSNIPLVNPSNPTIGNIAYNTMNSTLNKNDVEHSLFLNSQNVNMNSNIINMDAESEEESEDSKEDAYILELIYSRRFSELSDKDLLSNLFLIAKEQAGCRFLQQKIDDNPNFANYELYPEIHDFISEFICDPFGNYLVQKMLESLTTEKINHMMKNVI